MQTLYWHDYETFGIDPARDAPSQFAGLRTDTNLNVIGDPLVEYCQPRPGFLPAPEACLVTGITPDISAQKGVVEAEFFAKIHRELAQPNTCGVGYNSIRFDDEVSRYGFYRNFFDPYAREWQNGNSRWDIIDMVRLVYALRPESLAWPRSEDGSPSFRLERLTLENNLIHQSAHDALSDVEATIDLARLIKHKQPALYDYCWNLRRKENVLQQIDVHRHKPLLHVSSKIPAKQGCTTIVMPLIQHPINRNAIVTIDLMLDPEPLLSMSADDIRQRMYLKTEQLAEGEQRIGIKSIHINRSPIVAPVKMLSQQAEERLGLDVARCEQHWRMLLTHPELRLKLTEVFSVEAEREKTDAEFSLYSGFIPNSDKPLVEQVRHTPPAQLAELGIPFSDARLEELLFLYRARNFPETLTASEQRQWQEQLNNDLQQKLPNYRAHLNQLLADLPSNDKNLDQQRAFNILNTLQSWADNMQMRYCKA